MNIHYRKIAVALAVLLGSAAGHAQSPTDLLTELRQLREDMQRMQAELDRLKAQQASPVAGGVAAGRPAAPEPGVAVGAQAAQSPNGVTGTGMADAGDGRLSLFGYGELYYTRPRHNAAEAMATARRGVIGLAYRFNERTRFAAELEIENGVVSASDQGEAAFEQLYIEHDVNEHLSAKAGLFLLPIGYMNETHEPTRYHGVTRNLVETAIIPTTWREMGVGLQGRTAQGLRWNTGVVTSFDLNKWPADSAETRQSPLGAIHQEGQLARAASLAYYGALNYDGFPGLNLGGSLFSGGIGQKQATLATPRARVNLAEIHARWQMGRWDLSTLAAEGRFEGVAAFNASGAGAGNPVPDRFRGWYAQAAYRLWRSGEQSLVPFGRYERVNTALGFSGLPQGLAPTGEPDARVMTLGASYYLHPQVVLKIDTQRYFNNGALDRVNLGAGFHF